MGCESRRYHPNRHEPALKLQVEIRVLFDHGHHSLSSWDNNGATFSFFERKHYFRTLKKLAAYNIKGGVGKTTTAVNLACMLASQGYSVLLWDLDPQGGSSFFFNLQNNNDQKQSRLFDQYITIYDVIQSTDTYHIDVISNDSQFTDQFMNKAARITALDYVNHDLLKRVLREVEDDYDICIFDCPPGRFLLHDNIFKATDAILVPNVPSPLSVYCNNLLLRSLAGQPHVAKKILSFFNMVQIQKNIHKHFLEKRNDSELPMLQQYVPFYTEIESITVKKESIFHQLKQAKTSTFYFNLWNELCERLGWQSTFNVMAPVVNIRPEETPAPVVLLEEKTAAPFSDAAASL